MRQRAQRSGRPLPAWRAQLQWQPTAGSAALDSNRLHSTSQQQASQRPSSRGRPPHLQAQVCQVGGRVVAGVPQDVGVLLGSRRSRHALQHGGRGGSAELLHSGCQRLAHPALGLERAFGRSAHSMASPLERRWLLVGSMMSLLPTCCPWHSPALPQAGRPAGPPHPHPTYTPTWNCCASRCRFSSSALRSASALASASARFRASACAQQGRQNGGPVSRWRHGSGKASRREAGQQAGLRRGCTARAALCRRGHSGDIEAVPA